jgi:hypothetical protein
MRQHFPEIVGLTFAAAVAAVFLFASLGGSTEVVLGGAGAVGAGAFARKFFTRKKA